MRYFKFSAGILLLILVIIGCSGGSDNPVIPPDSSPQNINDAPPVSQGDIINADRNFDPVLTEVSLIEDTYHSLATLGAFELNLNAQDLSAELIALRKTAIGESYLVSGASFFTMTPCLDCLKVESIELTEDNLGKLNFNISHPFDKGDPSKPPTASNRLDLDVFDLALIIVPKEADPEYFPLTGIQTFPGLCPEADGYTREIARLTETLDACPYFLVVDDSASGDFTYNKFEMGTHDHNFSVYFSNEGTFELYLTMGYGASARKFTRFSPQYYNPEFNRKSAWKVEVIPPQGENIPEMGNTWDDVDTETEYPVTILVYDWQQDATVSTSYPDEFNRDHIFKSSDVSLVSVEIPGMTNGIGSATTPISGSGSPQDPLVYEISLANENALPEGEYFGMVKVSDERTPATYVTPGVPDALVHSPDGIDLNWLEIEEYVTYQVFTATVVLGENITVTNPNGGETWIFSQPATVEWTSQGSTTNVNIELSLDSGQNYTVPIANNQPNDGSYDLAQVGEWMTETARIRVYNPMDMTIIDESDADFSIICPDLNPPSNVNATDGDFHDRVTVSWDPYTGATGYNIYRDDTLQVSDYTGTSWDDTNVTPGDVYNYQVQTVKGNCTSAKSANEEGHACVLPDTPVNVSATDGDYYDKVTVTWDPATLADTYNIYRDSSLVESNWATTTWDDTDVTMGINYNYQVESVNDCGTSDLSTGDQGHACILPDIPSNVSATDGLYHDHVTVSWDSAYLADTYNIYRDSQLKESNWSGTTWDDTTAVPGTVYSYQVESVNDCGTSDLSTGDNGNACELPGAPSNLTASDGTQSDHIHLSWTAGSLADTYNIYRDNSLIQSDVTGTNYDDYTASGGKIYSYEVESENDCGTSTSKSNSDNGWYPGCSTDSDDTCGDATRIEIEDSVSGCVDMIDEDWYWFYVTPNGFTTDSEISLTVDGNVDVTVYGHDPGGNCPGTQLQAWTDVGTGTLSLSSQSSMSKIFIKLKGSDGQVNYTMDNTFIPVVTNFPIEIWVATDNGNSSGTWPTNGSGTELDVALITQMVTWNNNFWTQYGYNLVWDGTPEFLSAQYYVLNNWDEESQMHDDNNSGGNKCDLYYVDQLCPGYNTAYCWTFDVQSDHNASNVYTVYSPNIWYWQDVIAHEFGHAIGYYNDQYLYGSSGCPCGDHDCFNSYFGYYPYLYDNPYGCYNGNLMWYYINGWTWDQFDLTDGQYNWIHEFHFTNPSNYPWY